MNEKCIKVGFYFDKEPQEERDARLAWAREILTEHGGTFRETAFWKKGVYIVIFLALIPEEQYYRHHSFDSELNGSFPKGCGAGFVVDSIDCY